MPRTKKQKTHLKKIRLERRNHLGRNSTQIATSSNTRSRRRTSEAPHSSSEQPTSSTTQNNLSSHSIESAPTSSHSLLFPTQSSQPTSQSYIDHDSVTDDGMEDWYWYW